MSVERTLCIVKPDAVERGLVGAILGRIESEGFRIAALRMLHLSPREAAGFYEVHRGKPFFDGLVDFMSSGPCVVAVLEAEDAIRRYRALMGATDPARAEPGTLRALYASSVQRNAVHGSDAPGTAAREIAYFFSALDQH